ncbi:MAG: hypothetical protein HKM89_07240 [Gemmatimonadales bacterium]|nr:hypothetical protein [Gemmatimonadales bacterium]
MESLVRVNIAAHVPDLALGFLQHVMIDVRVAARFSEAAASRLLASANDPKEEHD